MGKGCTCDITMGEIIDEVIIDSAKRPVRRVHVDLCEACASYTERRTALIPVAEARANLLVRGCDRHSSDEKSMKWNRAFHAQLTRLCSTDVQ